MLKFVLALVGIAAIEAAALAIAIGRLSAGGPITIRFVIVFVAAVALPALLGYGVWQRARNNSVRRAALEQMTRARPDEVIFGAEPTDRFIAEINNLRRASGAGPIQNSRMPLIVAFSEGFMTITMTAKKSAPRLAILLPTSTISGITVESVIHTVPGTRKNVAMETLRVSISPFDLFIPVQLRGIGASTRQELVDIAAAVSAKIGSPSRR